MVRKRELTLGATIFLIATLAYLLGWTNLFSVKTLQITGAPNTQIIETVTKYSEVKVGEKMARVEPRSIESRLKSAGIDWLESVDITRNWISGQVQINLKAREAIAITTSATSSTSGSTTGLNTDYKYVDAEGVIFQSPVKISEKLPELSGATSQDRANGIKLYQRLPDDFRGKVTKIVASSQDQFQLHLLQLDKVLRINWGSANDSEVKIKIYKALMALPENKQIKSMDLSDPTKPSVK